MSEDFNIFEFIEKGEREMRSLNVPPPYKLQLTEELLEVAKEQVAADDRMAYKSEDAEFRISDTHIVAEGTELY